MFVFSGLLLLQCTIPKVYHIYSAAADIKVFSIKAQHQEEAFDYLNPKPASQLVSKMPSPLAGSLHPCLLLHTCIPTKASRADKPNSPYTKASPSKQGTPLSTQHLHFCQKQRSFKQQRKPTVNQ